MGGAGAEGHGRATVVVVESLGSTPFVVGGACFTGGFSGTALEDVGVQAQFVYGVAQVD